MFEGLNSRSMPQRTCLIIFQTQTLYRDEFIRYRIAVCDAKLNVIRRKLRCKAILTAQKNVVCMRFPCVHECMHLRTVFQFAIKDLRLYAISFYLSRGTQFVLLSAYAISMSFP